VPLVWPETLPLVSVAPRVSVTLLKKPEVKVEPKPVRVMLTNNSAMTAPAAAPTVERRGGVIAHGSPIVQAGEDGPSLYHAGSGMGNLSLLGAGIGDGGPGPAPTIVTRPPKTSAPLAVSSGIIKGLLLAPIEPVYPRIAIAARVEGTVILTATINKQGRITGLLVLSGPMMLQPAAAEAVREARYKPYLLNGQPTDVITTISVTFRIGG
jgi:protein TonB